MSEKKYYSITEVSKILDVSISTVHRYLNENLLNAYRPAGRGPWRVPVESLRDFQNNHMQSSEYIAEEK